MILIAHNEMGHDEEEVKGEDGETVSMCSLYPGMTCRQHVDISVEVDNSREEVLPKVEFVETTRMMNWDEFSTRHRDGGCRFGSFP